MSQTSWPMWAGVRERGYANIAPNRRYAELYGNASIEPVLVIEDPDGEFWGWIYAEGQRVDTGERHPVMIQGHEGLFSMQFPYGPKAEEAAGKGRVVRLRIEPDSSRSA